MAVTKIKPIKGTLNKALDYIQNPEKTDGKMLVSSFGCSYETADIEFAFTLSQALDKGSNLAHHLIQAFEPGEVDYQTAHEIGRQLADAVTKGRHEYVLTTHIDKGHIGAPQCCPWTGSERYGFRCHRLQEMFRRTASCRRADQGKRRRHFALVSRGHRSDRIPPRESPRRAHGTLQPVWMKVS